MLKLLSPIVVLSAALVCLPSSHVDAEASDIASSASAAMHTFAVFESISTIQARSDFSAARDAVAVQVAVDHDIDPQLMVDIWTAAPLDHQQAIMSALSQLGVKYRRNTSSPGRSFDCSGLTSWAWSTADVELPHQSRRQMESALDVNADEALPGDLVYYPGHVMMYLGVDDLVVHAPNSGATVEVRQISAHRRNFVRFANPGDLRQDTSVKVMEFIA